MRNFNNLTDLKSLNNLSGLNDLFSLISSKKNTWFFHQPWHQSDLLWSDNMGFFWRLWRTGMLLSIKSKGHKSNAPYSGFPNHLQIKSNMHISIRQSQRYILSNPDETPCTYLASKRHHLSFKYDFSFEYRPIWLIFVTISAVNPNNVIQSAI